MDFLQLKIYFISFILLIEGTIIKKRIKRYPTPPPPTNYMPMGRGGFLNFPNGRDGDQGLPPGLKLLESNAFQTIINTSTSIECPKNHIVKRSFSLEVDSLQSGLREKWNSNLIGEESSKNFKNLLNLGIIEEEEDIDQHFQSTKSPLYNNKLTEDLKKWKALLHSVKNRNISKSFNEQLPHNTTNSFLEKKQNKDSNRYRKISEVLQQHNISLNELLDYVKSFGISTNPKILMTLEEKKHRRRKRNADGSYSVSQYCYKVGAPVFGDYLRICADCAVTTTLSPDKYPRTINEDVCDRDVDCLVLHNTAGGTSTQGKCIQTYTKVKFLRLKPNGCRKVTFTGEIVKIHQWEQYHQSIRTGCACTLEKHSKIRNSLGIPEPVG